MSLSKRLNAIYNLVDYGSSLADIGADHGQLIIELYHNKVCKKLFCNDNKIGPYTILKSNVSKVSEDIEVSLSSGIEALPSYIDTLVIAGMGGDLIIDIINKHVDKLTNISTIILAPNTNVNLVRQVVSKLGYKITKEVVVFEKHYYQIIRFDKGETNYTKNDYLFGPILRIEKSKEFLNMLDFEKSKLEHILKGNINDDKIKEIQEKIKEINHYED
mgnify:FL=1